MQKKQLHHRKRQESDWTGPSPEAAGRESRPAQEQLQKIINDELAALLDEERTHARGSKIKPKDVGQGETPEQKIARQKASLKRGKKLLRRAKAVNPSDVARLKQYQVDLVGSVENPGASDVAPEED